MTSRRRPASKRRTAITAPGGLRWSSLRYTNLVVSKSGEATVRWFGRPVRQYRTDLGRLSQRRHANPGPGHGSEQRPFPFTRPGRLGVVVTRPPVLPHGSDVVRDRSGGSPAAGHADHPGHSNSWIQGPREFVGALPVVFTATEKTFAHQREKATDNYGLGRFG